MPATTEQLQVFATLPWSIPYLNSPSWVVHARSRGIIHGADTDCFCRETICANNGVEQWLELHEAPAQGVRITKSISLCKFGPGIIGFPGIAHGGALLTLMDEAFLYIIVANDQLEHNNDFLNIGEDKWKPLLLIGRPPQEVLESRLVTARMDVKFLRPVPCPGVVGIEVNVMADKGHKTTMRGVMKDAEGVPLMQVDALWVRLGGVPKL